MDYVTHYPRHLPYNALFPSHDSDLSKQRREKSTRKVAEALSNERAEATAKFGAMQDKIALQSDPNPNPLTLTLTQVRCKTRLLGCSRTTPSCARPPSSCAAM